MSVIFDDSEFGGRIVDHRDADRLLAQAKAVCEPVLRESVRVLPQPFRVMAGYHLGFSDAHGVALAGCSGKGLRSGLVLATAQACGARSAEVAAAAAAVELVHNFTLVHDDVIDGDRTRRGRATVWSRWGRTEAILLGDVLHSAAIGVLTNGLRAEIVATAVERMATTIIELCRGQAEDCRFETRHRVGIDEYIAMVAGKTGSLMGCAGALGALCAGAEDPTVAMMDRFGRELGLALQFVDDLLGIWGDPARTGKPVGNDIARRKLSLPVVAAMASGTDAGAELVALYRSRVPLSTDDVARATALIDAAAGGQIGQELADERIDAALRALPDAMATDQLMALAHALTHRDR